MKILPGPSDGGKRLDTFIAERVDKTRSAIQKFLADGRITVNGLPAVKNYKLRLNDVVEFELPEPEMPDTVAQDISLDIVYEDGDLLVVNKPKGMVVHPAAGNHANTLVNALLFHCKDSLSGINGVIRPGIVHRIDKDTSGLLVVAKNDSAHISLAKQIAAHSFERIYEAIVCGHFKEPEGKIDKPIGRNPKDRKKMAVVPDGRNAVTHYKVIAEYKGFTHAAFKLETGRTHQIRVHMASVGHPIAGDKTYGASDKLGLDGQCLHAKTISFVHPSTNEFMRFESELPDYFIKTLNKLKEVDNG